jgi:hypothetical protein
MNEIGSKMKKKKKKTINELEDKKIEITHCDQ